jgi:YidC/Oxa1 family membrane protein insertase
MDDQNKNLLLATALSFLVILVWYVFVSPPEPLPIDADQSVVSTPGAALNSDGTIAAVPQAADAGAATTAQTPEPTAPEAPRLTIDTPKLKGTISLAGGRLDELSLKDYRETLDPESAIVKLMSPVGEDNAYYA